MNFAYPYETLFSFTIKISPISAKLFLRSGYETDFSLYIFNFIVSNLICDLFVCRTTADPLIAAPTDKINNKFDQKLLLRR